MEAWRDGEEGAWRQGGTEEVAHKDSQVVAEETAQERWAPEEVVGRPLETLMGEKPRWQKSSPGPAKRQQELPHIGG